MSPRRPVEHVLETRSEIAFAAAMPAEWVVRAVPGDYGIDREVEIFDDSRATGLTFKVQLKASARRGTGAPRRRVEAQHLAYWNNLDVPVLLVYYVGETAEIYGRWAHTVGREPGGVRGPATVTVTFGPEDALDGAADRLAGDVAVVRSLRAGIVPRPLPLRLIVDPSFGMTEAAAAAALRSAVRRLQLRGEVDVLPPDSAATPAVSIELEGGTRTVLRSALPADVSSVRVVLPAGSYADADTAPQRLATDILVAVAVVVAAIGATAAAARLLGGTLSESVLASDRQLAYRLADVLYEHDGASQALAVTLRLWDSDDMQERDTGDVYFDTVLRNLRPLDSAAVSALVSAMRVRADREAGSARPRRAGRAHYNLAQTLNALHRTDDAIASMNDALAHDSGYERRAYFFRERAGYHWTLDRFSEAADDYRRALDAGHDPAESEPLLADALLYAGRYGEALDVLEQRAPAGHDLDRLAALDLFALRELVGCTGLAEQHRVATSDDSIEAARSEADLIELLRTTDALDPRIWLRLAGDPPSPARLVIVALVLLNSAVAWATATAAAFDAATGDTGDVSLAYHIIDSAAALTHDDEYERALDALLDGADPPFADRLRDVVLRRLHELGERRPAHVTRLIFDEE